MKKAFIITGSPAAGKSTYGRTLAEEHGAVLLDLDTATERLVRLALKESGHDEFDRDSPHYKEVYRNACYEVLFDIACENLQHTSVVVIGPFTRELRDPDWLNKLETRLNSTVEVRYLSCNPETRKLRMKQRNNPRDVAKLENWEEYSRYYRDESRPVFNHIYIDTSEES